MGTTTPRQKDDKKCFGIVAGMQFATIFLLIILILFVIVMCLYYFTKETQESKQLEQKVLNLSTEVGLMQEELESHNVMVETIMSSILKEMERNNESISELQESINDLKLLSTQINTTLNTNSKTLQEVKGIEEILFHHLNTTNQSHITIIQEKETCTSTPTSNDVDFALIIEEAVANSTDKIILQIEQQLQQYIRATRQETFAVVIGFIAISCLIIIIAVGIAISCVYKCMKTRYETSHHYNEQATDDEDNISERETIIQ